MKNLQCFLYATSGSKYYKKEANYRKIIIT